MRYKNVQHVRSTEGVQGFYLRKHFNPFVPELFFGHKKIFELFFEEICAICCAA